MKKPRKTTKRASTPIEDLPPNPFVFEVLNVVCKQRTTAKKVEALKKFEHASLKALFIWNFDDTVISMLPPGEVPYSSLKDEQNTSGTLSTRIDQQSSSMRFNNTVNANQGFTTLRREYTKLYNFIRGGNDQLNGLRRETMFIQILEGLHPLDAEILCLVKDKLLQTKYKLTRQTISDAYPDITWGGRS
tara:strand:+ start:1273 stop:1839 length:567 start_codon:yes stop_codon:yes gene_type:complete